jgi:hypothetical protein
MLEQNISVRCHGHFDFLQLFLFGDRLMKMKSWMMCSALIGCGSFVATGDSAEP